MSTKDTSKDLGTKGKPKDFDEELREIYYDKTVNTSSAKRFGHIRPSHSTLLF